jgi:hypothetical protein
MSDDYGNYVFRSADRGRTWTPIAGDLPAGRVARTLREDPRNPRVLYLGTELGLFVTLDRGARWIELKGHMPLMAFNDLAIHPRDNDLVLASHSRGVWILDSLSAIQELTPAIVSAGSHLFSIRPAEMIRYSQPKAHAGDMIFRGENPPAGAIIDYYTPAGGDVGLTVHDRAGNLVQSLTSSPGRGVHRVIWNLRHASLPPPAAGGAEEDDARRAAPVPGPFVVPGEYLVRMRAGGRTFEQRVRVSDDPRLAVPQSEREQWTATLLDLAELYRDATSIVVSTARAAAAGPAGAAGDERRERSRIARELQARILTLYRAVGASTGPMTADQRSQHAYFKSFLEVFEARLRGAA